MTMTPERARELIGHTPGPWDCHFGSDAICQCKSVVGMHGGFGSLAVISVDNGLHISEGGNDAPDEEQAKANARLIAASPDLLAGYLALAEENERLRAPPKITDAMVDAAVLSTLGRPYPSKQMMRAALTAALASTPVDTSRGGMG